MTTPSITRRQVLAGGLGAAAAVALSAVPGSRRAGAGLQLANAAASVGPAGTNLQSIKHVVFLMHENRSFDHYFGALAGVNGFATSSPAFSQAWPGGRDAALLPFHLDTTVRIGECTHDLDHTWQSQHSSWNDGAMDSWVSTHTSDSYEGAEYGTLTMGYYDANDLPLYYALAQNFTVCDNYFCSVLGPTGPNRLMWMSGTCDPAGSAGGPILVTESSNAFTFSCSWPTMPELLQDAGISWKFYNPYGPSYQPNGNAVSMLLDKNPLFFFSQYSDPNSSLYQNAFGSCGIPIPSKKSVFPGLTGPPPFAGGGPNDFATDVKAGTLPEVSWIIAPDGYDEHPPAPPALGEWYTAQVIKTLMSNKAVWESTVLFITYDENGGFFDHVTPPTAPTGTPGEYVTAAGAPAYSLNQPIGLGVRVPMLVVSPFSTGGWVCSDVFDHTSQLQFLAKVFHSTGLDGSVSGNVSAWRQSTVGDLTAALPMISLPTTPRGAPIYPPKPHLPPTSDMKSKAPVNFPTGCSANNLLELGSTAVQVCTTTAGSITVTSTTDFVVSGIVSGMPVEGPGIPSGTTVVTATKATRRAPSSITMSAAATASGIVTLSFPFSLYPIPDPQSQPTPSGAGLKPS
jgi:phospholipase C